MNKVTKAIALSAAAAALTLAGAGAASADSTANGIAANSPGFLSGNLVQVPVHIPINLCGNSINVIGALNPAFGNACVNNS
ncbi:chaplin [Streptacidiphilus sp. MAP5-3]|uniref:chaplin n=2 Tax=Streptacidiphilus TaxID=228398 RepID=UPI00351326C2